MTNLNTVNTLVASTAFALLTIGCGEMSDDYVGSNYQSNGQGTVVEFQALPEAVELAANIVSPTEDVPTRHIDIDTDVIDDIDLQDRLADTDFEYVELEPTEDTAGAEDEAESTPGMGDGYGSRIEWKNLMLSVCDWLGGSLSDNTFGPERRGLGYNAVNFYCNFSDDYEIKYESFVVGGEGSCKPNADFNVAAEAVCDSIDNVVLHKGLGDCGGDKSNPYSSAMLFVCKAP